MTTPDARSLPHTAAGQALLEHLPMDCLIYTTTDGKIGAILDDILAIEAAAAPTSGLREALERLTREGVLPWEEYTPPVYIPPANMRLRKSYLDALAQARAALATPAPAALDAHNLPNHKEHDCRICNGEAAALAAAYEEQPDGE